ncbi:N-acetylmuramoyl-L-alanine amidase family protein [Helicobacter colisuis]|uniref:N-acetylmuramoyl-L-alanine amidase family protein n=1 Tax=Helicobacter colisuis TaxID=2949739 RepID=UPI00202A502D|nr:N-acetylmuramoyl-L-alanine amidase [Helicobacter colisuis]MCL9822995.1 N-acetylmuramoyl-L-alanine amidase [Helicobacter colisuis]
MLRIIALFFCFFHFAWGGILEIQSIKQTTNGVALNFNQTIEKKDFKSFVLENKEGFRYVYDIPAVLMGKAKLLEFEGGISLRIAQNSPTKVRLVIQSPKKLTISLNISKKQAHFSFLKEISIPSLFENNAKQESLKKDRKTIVIDPGHGGKDCGAIGVNKTCEKIIVLSIGKYLRDILQERGYKVYMTRSSDKFIKLRERTSFANDKEADLFISIHANAIVDNKNSLEGVESYFLSTARSEKAKNVAALENKDDIESMNYFSKQSVLNTLNTQRIIASNRLAIDIQYGMLQSLRKNYKIVDGGVREGPFWVLVGALMPSVLLEVGYITHPTEGKRLTQTAFQKNIAKGIADGIDNYFIKNP